MSESPWDEMAQALLELERALRELGFWAAAPPAADRMSSAAPFCIDTLSFEEWLQWILIPRLGGIAARRERLSARQQPLLVVLAQIDQLSHKLL